MSSHTHRWRLTQHPIRPQCFLFPFSFLLSLSRARLSPLGEEVFPDHFRVSVNSRIQAHTLNPANHLCNLALIDRTKARARRVRNLSRRRRELLNQRKVLQHPQVSQLPPTAFRNKQKRTHLVHIQRSNSQRINHIPSTRRPLPPLLHLHRTHIMRRVNIARIPPPRHLPQVIIRVLLVPQQLNVRLLVPHSNLSVTLKPGHQVRSDVAGVARRRAGRLAGGSRRAGVVDGEKAAAGGGAVVDGLAGSTF